MSEPESDTRDTKPYIFDVLLTSSDVTIVLELNDVCILLLRVMGLA